MEIDKYKHLLKGVALLLQWQRDIAARIQAAAQAKTAKQILAAGEKRRGGK